jgi:hypothetical protein
LVSALELPVNTQRKVHLECTSLLLWRSYKTVSLKLKAARFGESGKDINHLVIQNEDSTANILNLGYLKSLYITSTYFIQITLHCCPIYYWALQVIYFRSFSYKKEISLKVINPSKLYVWPIPHLTSSLIQVTMPHLLFHLL